MPSNSVKDTIVGPQLDGEALMHQYGAFKVFVAQRKVEYETKQRLQLNAAETELTSVKNQQKSLASVLSKRKLIKLEKLEKSLEDIVSLFKIWNPSLTYMCHWNLRFPETLINIL